MGGLWHTGLLEGLLLFYVGLSDIHNRLIPNWSTAALLPGALLLGSMLWGKGSGQGALIGILLLLALRLLTRGGVGGGDLKLVLSLGAMAGFPGILYVLGCSGCLALPAALYSGLQKKERRRDLPFAPFLIIASAVFLLRVSGS